MVASDKIRIQTWVLAKEFFPLSHTCPEEKFDTSLERNQHGESMQGKLEEISTNVPDMEKKLF
jgi:hypothetical protein